MYRFIHHCCLILLLSVAIIDARTGPHIVTGTIYRPSTGLKQPFKAWFDPQNFRSRVDYFDSDVKTYQLPHGKTHTNLYRITPAIDSSSKWTACFTWKIDGVLYQPAIPIFRKFRNKKNTTINNIATTLFWDKYSKRGYTYRYHYYIRYENLNEIPVRYEQSVQGPAYSKQHFIDYEHYTGVRNIFDSVFAIDPKIFEKCSERNRTTRLNPMSEFVKSFHEESINVHAKTFNSLVNRYENKERNIETEVNHRQMIFERNIKFIEAVNRQRRIGYRLGVNKFTDQTDEEFSALLGIPVSPSDDDQEVDQFNSSSVAINMDSIPKQLDCRENGLVTRVKDQQNCGCCYVFAAIGALEGAYSKKTGKLISLSEQSVLECASWVKGERSVGGCFAGWPHLVLNEIQKLGGIPAEHDYLRQYSALEPKCELKNVPLILQIKKVGRVPKYNISELKKALTKYGPLAIAAHVSEQFKSYSEGVFDDPDCDNRTLNHAMILVGYGEQIEKPYWLVKNSWGPDWGENGYIKISQENNRCGMLDYAVYVELQ